MTPAERPVRLSVSIQHFPPYLGGAERQAEILLPGLAASDRITNVTVVSTRFDRKLPRKQFCAGYRLRRLLTVSSTRVRMPVNFLSAFVYFLCRGYRYDFLHCICLSPFNLGAILAAKAWGRPTLVKVCSVGSCGDIQKIKQLPFGSWFWRLFLLTDRFIAPTSSVADELCAEGVERETISIVPNALPSVGGSIDKKTARQQCEIPDKPTFLYVGRLSPDKNLDVLLEAWTGFSRRHDANLVIVGDGPLFGQVETWRSGLENPFSVILAGYRDDPALHYVAADVLVFPSRLETFGNVVIEAMNHGLAVLTTEVGVVKEWQGRPDMLATFDPDDAAELSERMAQLLADRSERERLGRNAKHFIEKRYDVGSVVDRYRQIYYELLRDS